LASELNKKTIPFFHPEAQLRKMERRNSNQQKNRFGLKASLYARTLPFKG